MAKRASGSKLYFYTLHGEGKKLQIMADARRAAVLTAHERGGGGSSAPCFPSSVQSD